MIIVGDNRIELKRLANNSVDAIVTDPPYGLEFMGKDWDRFTGAGMSQPGIGKRDTPWPSFTGSNTKRCSDCGLLVGHGGSPCKCATPRVVSMIPERMLAFQKYMTPIFAECLRVLKPGGHLLAFSGSRTYHRLASAVEDAGFEIRDQIMWIYGSGFPKSRDISKAIDKAAGAEREKGPIDPSRAGRLVNQTGDYKTDAGWSAGSRTVTIDPPATKAAKQWEGWGTALKPAHEPIVMARKPCGNIAANVLKHATGALNIDACRVPSEDQISRWPANVIHDGSEEVNELLGTPSRFFYCAKANKKDRGEGNNHPTVKPTELMRYLVRLVTPTRGIVLDPFCGSGSTGKACRLEGFEFIGIEINPEYAAIAETRVA